MKSTNQILTCIYILASLLAVEGVRAQSDAISAAPYRGGGGSGSIGLNPTRFARLDARATGIAYQHRIESLHRDKRLYHSSFACGTPMLGDVNLDGAPDIFITGGPSPNALYLQTGNLQFADVTPNLGLGGVGLWAGGGVMVDIDNDGDLDIYVCYYDAPNHLYINQLKETGQLAFVEGAAQYGLNIRDASLVPAFADYDADGDLDLYLLTHQLHRLGGRPCQTTAGKEQIPMEPLLVVAAPIQNRPNYPGGIVLFLLPH
ncbi:MAG: VCBS repeat-containing protein [Verrucomicrobiota bacterium]